jgi:tetratricopeptide (TPR) repeat protein
MHLTETLYGAGSRSYATNLAHYAQVFHNAGRPAEALPIYMEALPLLRTAFGPETPFYATMLAETARAEDDLNRAAKAEDLYEQAYAIMKARLGIESFERSSVAYKMGQRRAGRGDHSGALPYLEDAAAVRVGSSVAAAKLSARATYAWGAALLALDRREEALPHLRAAEPRLRELLGEDHEESRAANRALSAMR